MNKYKKILLLNLENSKKNFFFKKYEDFTDLQKKSIEKSKDFYTLTNCISLRNLNFTSLFKEGYKKSFFIIGKTDKSVFNLYLEAYSLGTETFYKKERLGKVDILWKLSGNYFSGENSIDFPEESVMLDYTHISSNSFSLNGKGKNISKFRFSSGIDDIPQFAYRLEISFSNLSFNLNFSFNDSFLEDKHNFNLVKIKEFSNFNLNLTLEKNQKIEKGFGNIIETSVAEIIPKNVFKSFYNMISDPKTNGIFKVFFKDDTNETLYSCVKFFKENYEDCFKIKEKKKICGYSFRNKKKEERKFFLEILETVDINGVNLPKKFYLNVENENDYLFSLSTIPVYYKTPLSHFKNVYDISVREVSVGWGTLEIEGYLSEYQYSQRFLKACELDFSENSLDIVSKGLSPTVQKGYIEKGLILVSVFLPLLMLFLLFYKETKPLFWILLIFWSIFLI